MSFSDGRVVLGPGEGKTIKGLGQSVTFKAVKEDTRGAYSLLEANFTGGGTTQHIHHAEEEAFYVLEGEVNVKVGERAIRAAAGAFVLIPRGTVHALWNVGATPRKLLIITSPAGFEQLVAELAGDSEIDLAGLNEQRSMAIAQKYNMEIVGPPLG